MGLKKVRAKKIPKKLKKVGEKKIPQKSRQNLVVWPKSKEKWGKKNQKSWKKSGGKKKCHQKVKKKSGGKD